MTTPIIKNENENSGNFAIEKILSSLYENQNNFIYALKKNNIDKSKIPVLKKPIIQSMLKVSKTSKFLEILGEKKSKIPVLKKSIIQSMFKASKISKFLEISGEKKSKIPVLKKPIIQSMFKASKISKFLEILGEKKSKIPVLKKYKLSKPAIDLSKQKSIINLDLKDFIQQLKCGLDIDAQDNKGRTLVSYAVELGDYQKLKFLAKNGADLDIADINGDTPVHYAAKRNQPKILNFLREKGACMLYKNNLGFTFVNYLKDNCKVVNLWIKM